MVTVQQNYAKVQRERMEEPEESYPSDGYLSDLKTSNRRLKFKSKNFKRVRSTDVYFFEIPESQEHLSRSPQSTFFQQKGFRTEHKLHQMRLNLSSDRQREQQPPAERDKPPLILHVKENKQESLIKPQIKSNYKPKRDSSADVAHLRRDSKFEEGQEVKRGVIFPIASMRVPNTQIPSHNIPAADSIPEKKDIPRKALVKPDIKNKNSTIVEIGVGPSGTNLTSKVNAANKVESTVNSASEKKDKKQLNMSKYTSSDHDDGRSGNSADVEAKWKELDEVEDDKSVESTFGHINPRVSEVIQRPTGRKLTLADNSPFQTRMSLDRRTDKSRSATVKTNKSKYSHSEMDKKKAQQYIYENFGYDINEVGDLSEQNANDDGEVGDTLNTNQLNNSMQDIEKNLHNVRTFTDADLPLQEKLRIKGRSQVFAENSD